MKFPVKRALALLAALLTAGGCAVPRNNFDRIAAHIETGGSCYSVTDLAPLEKRAALLDEGFVETALHNGDVQPENRRKFFRRRALAQTFWYVAGLDMVRGWGASSVPRSGIAEDDPVPVRNRFFALMPTAEERGINGFFAVENRSFRKELASLPQGVGIVLCGDIRPSSLNRALKECGAVAEKWGGVMEFLANFPLAGSDGVWLIAAAPSIQSNFGSFAGWRLKIDLPDTDGKLFAALAMMLDVAPQEKRIAVPLSAPGVAPVLLRKEGKLSLYNTPEAEKYFETPVEKLKDSPRFAALAADLPAEGVFFGYVDENCLPKAGDDDLDVSLLFAAEESGSGVLRREKEGWLWVENSSLDWHEQKMLLAVNLLDFVGEGLLSRMLGLTTEAAPQEPEPEVAAPPVPPEKSCLDQPLKKVAAALERYAADHQGNYPKQDGQAGWNELIGTGLLGAADCRCAGAKAGEKGFVYLGGFSKKNDSKLPVVIDRGHGDKFYVIFADGTAEQFLLERADSLPRIVSFLHTQYHWDERDFQVLIRKAMQLEKNQ